MPETSGVMFLLKTGRPRAGSLNSAPPGERHPWQGLPLAVHGRMAILAADHRTDEIFAPGLGGHPGGRWSGRGAGQRLWHRVDEQAQREDQLTLRQLVPDGRKRPEVHDDRREVLVVQMAKVHVGHDRKQGPPVAAHAFLNRAGDLVVAPGAQTGLDVRRQVRRRERPELGYRHDPSAAAQRDEGQHEQDHEAESGQQKGTNTNAHQGGLRISER
jgi:hypothetical protein